LQCSQFEVRERLSLIQDPSNASDIAKASTIALPYHIPCKSLSSDDPRLVELEQQCLEELHIRCLLGILCGRPIKGILLELILAGNGGQLSDRFLCQLAELSVQHGFVLIVDEIMTGAHTGTMLLTSQKPASFWDCVVFVTLGKWPGMAFVLKHLEMDKQTPDTNNSARGPSTVITLQEACKIWKRVVHMIPNASKCQQEMLSKLKVTEERSWGAGTIIFASKRRTDSAPALKFRYLPMLDNVKIDCIPGTHKQKMHSKEHYSLGIMDSIQKWLSQSRKIGDTDSQTLCQFLSSNTLPDGHFNLQEIVQFIQDKTDIKHSKGRIGKVVCGMVERKLALWTAKTSKRKRCLVFCNRAIKRARTM